MIHAIATCWSKPKPAVEDPPVTPAVAAPASALVGLAPPAAPNAQKISHNQAMIVKEDPEVVATAKGIAAGEQLPKQPRLNEIQVDSFLNPVPKLPARTPKSNQTRSEIP